VSAAPAVDTLWLDEVRDDYEARHPSEIIGWAIDTFDRRRRVVVTSLQAEGVAIADMALAFDRDVRLVTIDTGRLPEETLAYLDTLRRRWDRSIEVVTPDAAELQPFLARNGVNPFYESVDLRLRCCELRKVRPLQRVLADVDCWFSGLRRDHSQERSQVELIEFDAEHGGIVKINPLAAWSTDDVHDYLRRQRLPLHPLYAAGYTSIGCAPCTRAVRPGEDARAGRWWWEQDVAKECGIHGRVEIELIGEGVA